MKTELISLLLLAMTAGCVSTEVRGTKKYVLPEDSGAGSRPRGGSVRAMPFAYIYKTNGNYNDNVTARLDKATGQFISYPAPADVGRGSEPMVLADGWLLDRRGGIGSNTVFLRWTYAEYHALPSAPNPDELRAAIIAGARVTEVQRLDMTTFDAQADTAVVNRIIRDELGPVTTVVRR